MRRAVLAAVLALAPLSGQAATTYWAQWNSSEFIDGYGIYVYGTITTPTATLNVTYNNPIDVAFLQFDNSGGIDYWANGASGANGRNDAVSPYTSALVDNAPTGTGMIALQYAGEQTLTFSQAIGNPVFAFISLNGNGYSFNQDFNIISQGGQNGRDCGYWGCGTVTKEVNAGVYSLIGDGEPHGTIRFTGSFSSVAWNSLSSENWNGFTVGVQGTAQEVFNAPEPASMALLGLAAGGLALARRRRA